MSRARSTLCPMAVLGFGLPAAVGLQMAHPDRRVVCPIGDGSIQYSIQALWSAVQTEGAGDRDRVAQLATTQP